jgi:hypothetical protein
VVILLATEAQRTRRTAKAGANSRRNSHRRENTESANEFGLGHGPYGREEGKNKGGLAGYNGLGTGAEAVSSESDYHLFGR